MQRSAPFLLSRFVSNLVFSFQPPKPFSSPSILNPIASISPLTPPCRCPSELPWRRRGLSTGGEAAEYVKKVDEINLKFAEAREEIEAAMESKDTVYFDEEAQCARDAVTTAVDMFDDLLRQLPEAQRGVVQRSMGLKMEQLKAELKQLDD